MEARRHAAEAAIHDQTQQLPKMQLLTVFGIMSLALLVCFIDQNGIGVLLPTIGRDLDAVDSISWAGTSALIANTVFQVLYGRLSDLFGRKKILLAALALLSLSNLGNGLAVSSTMLYIFRGLAGVANGGIMSLTMMIVSDIVSLRDRGKYQGILGCMVGLGNSIGPLIAAAFSIHATWRGLFYLLSPLTAVIFLLTWKYIPSNMPKTNLRETIAKIDFLGLFLATCAVIIFLIPLSQGGHADTPWDSPMVISMLVIGALCFVAFLLVEGKYAALPIMPLGMFKNISVAAMLAQTFLLGVAYFSILYMLPLFVQNVRGESSLIAAALLVPLAISQSITSTLGGLYMTYFNRYNESIWLGFSLWTLGTGLLIDADETTSVGLLVLYTILIGAGTGCVFQITLVALQAHCPKAQRAVATSNRNFIRPGGGAVGLAASSAILSNVLRASLPDNLQYIAENTFAVPSLDEFSAADAAAIQSAYADANRAIYIFSVPVLGIALLLTAFIKDNGLIRDDEPSPSPAPTTSDAEKGEILPDDASAAAIGPQLMNRTVSHEPRQGRTRTRQDSSPSEKSSKSDRA